MDFPKMRRRNGIDYRWREFAPGDSKFYCVPNEAALRSSLSKFARRHASEFTARASLEGGMRGLRVWRVA